MPVNIQYCILKKLLFKGIHEEVYSGKNVFWPFLEQQQNFWNHYFKIVWIDMAL